MASSEPWLVTSASTVIDSGAAETVWRNLDIERLVDALHIESPNQFRHGKFEDLAVANQVSNGASPTGFNLRQVPC